MLIYRGLALYKSYDDDDDNDECHISPPPLIYLELCPQRVGIGQPVQQVSLERVKGDPDGLVLGPAVVLAVHQLVLAGVQWQVILVNVVSLGL